MAESQPNDLVTCPYDPSHQIRRFRMLTHLQKCKKQHPNSNKVSCPFDAGHVMNKKDLSNHVANCPKKQILDDQVHSVGEEARPPVQVQPILDIPCEENWDDNLATYVPEKKGPHVIAKIRCATRSERRRFRMEGMKNYKPAPDADQQ